MKIEGIDTIPDTKRLYPQGELASQVIGAVGEENEGLTGLEQSEDETLGGASGEQEVVHDARGEPIRFDTVKPPSIGDDIQLTLDAAIQDRAEQAIAEAGERFEAKGATAIVMDPNSGDVLAMANWPGYDPSELESASHEALANRATGFTYEPGSTFKAFTVGAALDEGIVNADHPVPPALDDQGRRPRDRGGARASADRRHGRRDPRAVLQRGRGHDRARGRRRAVRPLGAKARLRRAHRRRLSGRGAGHRARRSRTTRARRWATCRSARGWR